jgi:hypothetical protein
MLGMMAQDRRSCDARGKSSNILFIPTIVMQALASIARPSPSISHGAQPIKISMPCCCGGRHDAADLVLCQAVRMSPAEPLLCLRRCAVVFEDEGGEKEEPFTLPR